MSRREQYFPSSVISSFRELVNNYEELNNVMQILLSDTTKKHPNKLINVLIGLKDKRSAVGKYLKAIKDEHAQVMLDIRRYPNRKNELLKKLAAKIVYYTIVYIYRKQKQLSDISKTLTEVFKNAEKEGKLEEEINAYIKAVELVFASAKR